MVVLAVLTHITLITNVISKRLKFWEILSSTFYVTTSTSADPGGLYWTGAHLTQQSLGHCCGPSVHSIQESSIFDEIFSKPFSALHAIWTGVECKTDDDDAKLFYQNIFEDKGYSFHVQFLIFSIA